MEGTQRDDPARQLRDDRGTRPVFGDGAAIGDIKYKLTLTNWRRNDLYEVVAFATAAGADRAAIIEFRHNTEPQPPALQIGSINVRHFAWQANDDIDPQVAASVLGDEIAAWLNETPA
jgi:hypothetical protein